MSHSRNKNLLVGACMLCAGLVYFYMTTGLPRRGPVDAAFFPYALATGMILLGLIHLALNWRGKAPALTETGDDPVARASAAADDEDAPAVEGAKPDYMSVGISLVLIAGFTVLLRPLGFAISAALYLFLQFAVLSPASRPTPHILHVALAVGIALIVFVIFRYGFGLMLPAGPLIRFIP